MAATSSTHTLIQRYVAQDDYTAKVNRMTHAANNFTIAANKAKQASGGKPPVISPPRMPNGQDNPFSTMLGDNSGPKGGIWGMFDRASNAFNNFGSNSMLANILALPTKLMSSMVGFMGSLVGTIPVVGKLTEAFFQCIKVVIDLHTAIIGGLVQALEILWGVAGKVANALLKVGGILLAAVVGVGVAAVNAAMKFDTLERVMSAFLGDQMKGAQMAAFLQQYGKRSPFEQEAIFEAGKTIVAANQSVSRILPLLERIALLKGPQSENLIDVAAIFRRLIGGQIGEAFGPEGIGRFGINKKQLEMFGAKFDKGGQFIGGINDALSVLEKLLSSPQFARLTTMFESAPATKYSNALDALNIALVRLGQAILPTVIPLIEGFANAITDVVNSGVMKQFADSFLSMFGINGGQGNVDAIKQFVVNLAAVLLSIPALVKDVLKLVEAGAKLLIVITEAIANTIISTINSAIKTAATLLGGALGGMLAPQIANVNIGDIANTLFGAMNKVMESENSPFKNFTDALSKNKDDLAKRLAGGQGKNGENVFDPSKNFTGTGGESSDDAKTELENQTSLLKSIAQNTKEQLNFQRYSLGGGDLGRLGVTPVEMNSAKKNITITIKGGGKLEDVLKQLAHDMYLEMVRNQIVAVRR